jgi:hypothetical protein
MVNTQTKLAQALRAMVAAVTPADIAAATAQAREVIAEHDASTEDAVNLLVMREALRDYASAEYIRGRDLRDGKGDAAAWGADTRERFAQGCDIRRRAALKMAEELE